ncbi:MAG: phosphoglycolate phosphatase [Phycisphaerae bacterium]|nr:phosphoglycolate phosphatase [Phycisphaerae bacterium]
MTLPDLVIFDLDGTLIDSVPDLSTALNRMLHELDRPPVEAEHVRNWVGDGSLILVHRALSGSIDGRVDPETAESSHERFQAHYAACCMEQTRIFENGSDLIRYLRSRGVKTAVVTNKPERHAVRLMEAWSEVLPMDLVLGERSGHPRKPDPAMLLKAMGECQASTAWMVGDSEVDSLAARAAGAAFIGVRLGYNHGRDIGAITPCPDQVFDDLGSFLDWIRTVS